MLTGQNTREEAISFYQEYWERKGTYRNDLLYNPEVLPVCQYPADYSGQPCIDHGRT